MQKSCMPLRVPPPTRNQHREKTDFKLAARPDGGKKPRRMALNTIRSFPMQRLLFILITITLATHGISCATEQPPTTLDNFVIDSDWISVDLDIFEPHAINNSTQVAGDIITDNGSHFAGVWKQGFAEKLDGTDVTIRSSATAINDAGQVAGYQKGRHGNDFERAVLWNNGLSYELGTLNGIESRALAINNSGEVVGWIKNSHGGTDAFIWRMGTIEYPGILTSGNAINNNGQILGTIHNGHSVLWNKGLMQKLEPPGMREFTPLGEMKELKNVTDSMVKPMIVPNKTMIAPQAAKFIPTCLNDAGQVVGYIKLCEAKSRNTERPEATVQIENRQIAAKCIGDNAVLWNDGELQYLDSKGNGKFIPLGINKHGVISGKIDNRAAVWNKGAITILNDLFKGLRGWRTTEARGINDLGQIIVYATNGTPKDSKAFLVTPKTNVPLLIKGTRYDEIERETSRNRSSERKPMLQEKSSHRGFNHEDVSDQKTVR